MPPKSFVCWILVIIGLNYNRHVSKAKYRLYAMFLDSVVHCIDAFLAIKTLCTLSVIAKIICSSAFSIDMKVHIKGTFVHTGARVVFSGHTV